MSLPAPDMDFRTLHPCQTATAPPCPVRAKAWSGTGRWAAENRAGEAAVNAALTWIACAGWAALIGLVFLLVVFV